MPMTDADAEAGADGHGEGDGGGDCARDSSDGGDGADDEGKHETRASDIRRARAQAGQAEEEAKGPAESARRGRWT